MPTAWTLAQLQASVGNDLALVDGVQPVTYQAMDASGNVVASYPGVNGFGLAEQYTSAFGLEVITQQWSLQRNQMAAVTRALVKDLIVNASSVVWVIYAGPESIIWDTQWRAQTIRQDCLLSVCGTLATLETLVSTPDGSGGYSVVWSTVASNVQTRWELTNATEAEEFGKKYIAETWSVWSLQKPSIGQRWNSGLMDAQNLPIVYQITAVNPELVRSMTVPLFTRSTATRERAMTT